MSAFDEIDSLMRRTNKLYLAYFCITGSFSSYLISFTKFSRPFKMISVLSFTLLASGCLTWTHVIKTFTVYELAYLRAGLDKSYPEIKSSKNKA